MEIFSLLERVPAIIWSALLASGLTLTGVMLSNRSNTKRLLTQLEHDATQKAKDRMATLHREVYLRLAEEMARASSFLGKISQLDPANENIADGLAELFAAGAKAQLIAQPETSRLITELTARYGEMVMRLLGAVSPVHDFSIRIRISTEHLERAQSEVNRALSEMREMNESGNPNAARFEALQRSIEHSMQMVDDFAAQRDGFWSGHIAANREFNIALLEQMRNVGPLQAQTMAALRSELGLSSEAGEYQARIDENWQRMDALLKETMDKIADD